MLSNDIYIIGSTVRKKIKSLFKKQNFQVLRKMWLKLRFEH